MSTYKQKDRLQSALCFPYQIIIVSHISESILAEEEHGLEGLDPKDLGFHEFDGAAIDFDEAASALAVRDGDCEFLHKNDNAKKAQRSNLRGQGSQDFTPPH
jgi:hypothetical protein